MRAFIRFGNLSGPRPLAQFLSLGMHALLVGLLLLASNGTPSRIRPTLYDQVIAPHESKIVWYHLRDLPKISPEPATPKLHPPKAREFSKATMISDPNPAKPEKVLIRTPEEVTQPDRPLTPPNMIAIERKKDPPPVPLPAPNAGGQPEAVVRPDPPKPSPKPFVAPEPPAVTRRSPVAPGMLPAPDASAGLPSAVAGAGGASEVNAMVLNLLPPASRDAAPAGKRTEVSSGPNTVLPGGDRGGAGLHIAGVTVRPEPREPKPAEPLPHAESAPSPPILTSVAPLQNTLSAPLPPSSRTIPQIIEGNFRGRVVYAMVVPMRKLPGYAGDWTIWFSEHGTEASGLSGQMRAPLPVRKSNTVAAEQNPATGRIQLRAVIDKKGRVDSVTIIGKLPASGGEFAVSDLKQWEFLPALRNREAVDVDVVVEIPYGGAAGITPATLGTGTSRR